MLQNLYSCQGSEILDCSRGRKFDSTAGQKRGRNPVNEPALVGGNG